MELNGWQRIYCILVMLWVFFIAFDAYSYLKIADNKIAELKSAIERSQLN